MMYMIEISEDHLSELWDAVECAHIATGEYMVHLEKLAREMKKKHGEQGGGGSEEQKYRTIGYKPHEGSETSSHPTNRVRMINRERYPEREAEPVSGGYYNNYRYDDKDRNPFRVH